MLEISHIQLIWYHHVVEMRKWWIQIRPVSGQPSSISCSAITSWSFDAVPWPSERITAHSNANTTWLLCCSTSMQNWLAWLSTLATRTTYSRSGSPAAFQSVISISSYQTQVQWLHVPLSLFNVQSYFFKQMTKGNLRH